METYPRMAVVGIKSRKHEKYHKSTTLLETDWIYMKKKKSYGLFQGSNLENWKNLSLTG